MTNNYQNFTILNIPEHINQLVNFKKWRRVGSNLKGAIMIGIIEHCIYNNKITILNEMTQLTQSLSNDKAQKFRNTLQNALKKLQGKLIIDFIFEFLMEKDQYNHSTQHFLDEFLEQKFNYTLSDDELIQSFYKTFKIKLIIAKFPLSHNQNYQPIDSKDNNCIIIFIVDNKYYVIQQEQIDQVPKCRCCQNTNSKELVKTQCNHFICFICLKKQFSQNQSKINCNQLHCASSITYQDFQQIIKNFENNSQSKQITNQDCCILCKTKMSVEFLLKPQECSHQFCIQCLINKLIPNEKNDFQCLIVGCNNKFNQKELPSSISNKLTQSQVIQKQSEMIQKSETQEKQSTQFFISSNGKSINLNIQCHLCFKQSTDNLIFKNICGHLICKSCFLKIGNKSIEQFKCNVSKCNGIINSKELSQYFTKSQCQNSQQKCGNCDSIFKISESFTNTNCQHIVCQQCVNNIYKSQRTPKCLKCNIVINEEILDEYYLQISIQSTKDINEMKSFDPEFQKDCTFCHSPFSDYNTKQNLNCSNHAIGTCCIIFPLNCPQCDMSSLNVEKSKLHFSLLYNDSDFLLYQTKVKFK